MSDYTLDQARAIIDAEKCVRDEGESEWCVRHNSYFKGRPECRDRPEVADVAAQLLATVERNRGLVSRLRILAVHLDDKHLNAGHPLDTSPGQAIRNAINGEEVTG